MSQKPHFDALKIYSCGKHAGKGEIACYKQFSPFLTMFSTLFGTYFHFKCTLKCRLQMLSNRTSLKFCRLAMG